MNNKLQELNALYYTALGIKEMQKLGIRSLHGNLVRHKQTGKTALIFGKRYSGKTLLSYLLVKNGLYEFIADDQLLATVFIAEKQRYFLVGPDPERLSDDTIAYKIVAGDSEERTFKYTGLTSKNEFLKVDVIMHLQSDDLKDAIEISQFWSTDLSRLGPPVISFIRQNTEVELSYFEEIAAQLSRDFEAFANFPLHYQGLILASLIFSLALSKRILKWENIFALPKMYGQDWFSEKRQRISNSYRHILTLILPAQTLIPLFPSMPYERSFGSVFKSIPNQSAICFGNMVKSAPISKRNNTVWYPNFVCNWRGIFTSGRIPRLVRFLTMENSIDADSPFRLYILYEEIGAANFIMNFIPESFGGSRRGNDLFINPGDELTAKFFLQLRVRFGIHNFYLLSSLSINRLYELVKGIIKQGAASPLARGYSSSPAASVPTFKNFSNYQNSAIALGIAGYQLFGNEFFQKVSEGNLLLVGKILQDPPLFLLELYHDLMSWFRKLKDCGLRLGKIVGRIVSVPESRSLNIAFKLGYFIASFGHYLPLLSIYLQTILLLSSTNYFIKDYHESQEGK